MKKKYVGIIVSIILVGAFILATWYVTHQTDSNRLPRDLGTPRVVSIPEPKEAPTPVAKMNNIVIPKEQFEGGVKDLELSVGDVFGAFTVVNIEKGSQGSHLIFFAGETTIVGTLQHNSFPALVFTAKDTETEKLPQLYDGIYNQPVTVQSLVISDPSVISSDDFVFTDGNSNSRNAEVRIKNLRMSIPPVNAFGTAEVGAVRYLD